MGFFRNIANEMGMRLEFKKKPDSDNVLRGDGCMNLYDRLM